MPNVLVGDLSAGVHAALLHKAERHHQSLQQYLAVDDLQDMDFERVPTACMIAGAYELRANVTSDDATYVAVAEVLLTGDKRLAAATGPRCAIRALP